MEVAQRHSFKESAAASEASAALKEAEFINNPALARNEAASALSITPGWQTQVVAMLALARAGDSARALALVNELSKRFPVHTLMNAVWLPTACAEIEINRGNPDRALELLRAAVPYEQGQFPPIPFLYPAYVRGEAYLHARQGPAAAAEFKRILDHRGVAANFPHAALARLGLARARVLAGDASGARTSYQDFLALWKDADSDIPILQEAKAEYAKLK